MNNLHSFIYNLLRVACSCCLLTNSLLRAMQPFLQCDPWQESFDSRLCPSNRNAPGCCRIVGCCPSFVVVKDERLHVNNQQRKLGFRNSVICGKRTSDSNPCASQQQERYWILENCRLLSKALLLSRKSAFTSTISKRKLGFDGFFQSIFRHDNNDLTRTNRG